MLRGPDQASERAWANNIPNLQFKKKVKEIFKIHTLTKLSTKVREDVTILSEHSDEATNPLIHLEDERRRRCVLKFFENILQF